MAFSDGDLLVIEVLSPGRGHSRCATSRSMVDTGHMYGHSALSAICTMPNGNSSLPLRHSPCVNDFLRKLETKMPSTVYCVSGATLFSVKNMDASPINSLRRARLQVLIDYEKQHIDSRLALCALTVAKKEVNEAQKQINRARKNRDKQRQSRQDLESELSNIKQTRTWRIGDAFVRSFSRPGLHSFGFFWHLWKATRRHPGPLKQAHSNKNGFIKNNEASHCEYDFEKNEMKFTPKLHSRPKCEISINALGSNLFIEELTKCCSLVNSLDQRDMNLETPPVSHLLLIKEPASVDTGWWTTTWADFRTNPSGSTSLRRLIERYRSAGCRVVLWLTETSVEDINSDMCIHFDHVFNGDTRHCYGKHTLLPAVEGGIFNPFLNTRAESSAITHSQLIVSSDDSMFLGLLSHFKPEILPEEEEKRPLILKASRVLILSAEPPLGDPWQLRLAIQGAAAGVLVIYPGILPEQALEKLVVRTCKTSEEVISVATFALTDEGFWEREMLPRRRAALRDFCLADRLSVIAKAVGLESHWKPWPRVTVFVPTRRPHLLPNIIEAYRAQEYPDRELIIVVNTRDVNRESVARMNQNHPDVSIICLGQEYNVGMAMNIAIDLASGEQSIKMDDDDYYGPRYLMDMVLNLRSIDADLYGKPSLFYYLESENRTYRRGKGSRQFQVFDRQALAARRAHIAGSTHSGQTSFFRKHRFPIYNRGAVDASFYESLTDGDIVACCFDAYSLNVFRSANPHDHTWRIDEAALLRNAKILGEGRCWELFTF